MIVHVQNVEISIYHSVMIVIVVITQTNIYKTTNVRCTMYGSRVKADTLVHSGPYMGVFLCLY